MWTCKNCKEDIEDDFEVCWSCGVDGDGTAPTNAKDFEKGDFEGGTDDEAKVLQLSKDDEQSVPNILKAYCNTVIGINVADAGKFGPARLLSVQNDHFVVQSKGVNIHIPFTQIIRVMISPCGLVKTSFIGGKFPLVVKIFDFVIYKGSVGVSFGISD